MFLVLCVCIMLFRMLLELLLKFYAIAAHNLSKGFRGLFLVTVQRGRSLVSTVEKLILQTPQKHMEFC